MASFAGFLLVYAFFPLGLEPDAEESVKDMAELGRMKGMGDVPPPVALGSAEEMEDGC